MVTKVTYVGEGFTRKPPKYERFIRPMVRVHFDIVEERISMIQTDSNKNSCCPCAKREEKSVHNLVFYFRRYDSRRLM